MRGRLLSALAGDAGHYGCGSNHADNEQDEQALGVVIAIAGLLREFPEGAIFLLAPESVGHFADNPCQIITAGPVLAFDYAR